jgi:hypothetical protein
MDGNKILRTLAKEGASAMCLFALNAHASRLLTNIRMKGFSFV